MWELFEGHPLLRDIDVAIKLNGKKQRKPYSPRPRTLSVFPEELPDGMQKALNAMEEGYPGESGSMPVPSILTTTRTQLCEFTKAAQEVGLKVELWVDAAIAYERSVACRKKPLSPKTILSALRQIHDFVRYVGAATVVQDHLASRIRVHENRSQGAEPQQEAKVPALPDYAGIRQA